jgi:hypothetical protein
MAPASAAAPTTRPSSTVTARTSTRTAFRGQEANRFIVPSLEIAPEARTGA